MSPKPSYEELEQKVRLLKKTLESQNAMQDELLLFKAIVESSSEAIAVSDPQGQLVYINPAHEKLFGRSLEQARKLNYRDYYPPESLEIINQSIAPALERGESWEGVLDVFDAKGRRFPLWERADSLRDAEGKMRYGFGLMHDIAERRQAEAAVKKASDELEKCIETRTAELVKANKKLKQEIEARKKITDAFLDSERKLRENERRYREIANKIPGLLYQYIQHRDGSFSVPLISERIHEYSGCTSEEIMKNPSLIHNKWVHPDDSEMIQAAITESARTLNNYCVEHRVIKPDREIRWLRVEAVPHMLPNRDIFWNGIAIDITEARQAREEAQRAKMLLTETQKMAKVGGWELNLETDEQVWTEETYCIHEVTDAYRPDLEGGLSFFPGKNRKIIEEAIQKAVDTGQPYDLELDFVTAKGNPLFVRCKGKAHRKNQKIFKLSGTIQDITDRKISENALKESEARYRRMAENAPEIIYRYRFVPSPGFEYVNHAVTAITGYTPEEHYADPELGVKLVHPDDRSRLEEMKTGGNIPARPLALRWIRKDGRMIWTEQRNVPIRDDAGNLIAVEGMARDITEEKQAADALRKSEARYRRLVNTMNEGLMEADKNWKITFVNRRYCQILGISEENLLGKDIKDINARYTLENMKSAALRQIEIREQGKNTPYEIEFRRPDGKKIWLRVSPRAVMDSQGNFGGSVVIIADITESQKAQKKAKQQEQQLMQAERLASMGVLVSGIAHEINNPNNFISFNLPILRDYLNELLPVTDPKLKDAELFGMPYAEFRKELLDLLDDMEHGCHRISAIVSGLSEYSRNKCNTEHTWMDMESLVRKVYGFCQREIRKDIKSFEVIIPDRFKMICTDPHALEQILMNLLANAFQAINKNDSQIRLEVLPETDRLIFEIRDNGCGIDKSALEKIFDPFYTTKPPGEGTGLGLYICHSLAKSLGGRIEAESEPDTGSTFRVILNKIKIKTEC